MNNNQCGESSAPHRGFFCDTIHGELKLGDDINLKYEIAQSSYVEDECVMVCVVWLSDFVRTQ